MNEHEKINYVEFPSRDLTATKVFYRSIFDWEFEDFGPDYCAIHDAGLDGGFYKSNRNSSTDNGSTLVVLYSQNLEDTQAKIENAGGKIIKPIFEFPGGRRFHFCDPCGNELAVWSDINTQASD